MPQTFRNNKALYNVVKLIEIANTIHPQDILTSQLFPALEDKCWSDEINDPQAKQPNFSPLQVLKNHDKNSKFKYHYEKALKSDLKFPIILDKNYIVADGMHRLLKAYILQQAKIKAVVFETFPDAALINESKHL
jgi:disulfide oxidoreductase YuzD